MPEKPDVTGRVKKYGAYWPKGWSALDIELFCFRKARTEEQGGLGRAEHFWKIIELLWAPSNPVGNRSKYFIRNPWSERMIDEACRNHYLAVGGPGGSSKSETFALWVLVCFLADARNTLVGILSTDLKGARKRIWGSLVDFIRAIPSPNKARDTGLPLKIADSIGIIRYESPTFSSSDRSTISLIAAEKSKEKDAIGKLIGMHNGLVIIVADELSELTPAILEYALPGGNLPTNPDYQFVGLSNPNGYFDPFATIWKPKAGWLSIDVDSEQWETQFGTGLHFDAMKSPNVLANEIVFPLPGNPEKSFLPTAAKIADAEKAEGGRNSPRFWRMIRGFMCPTGAENVIYSEQDIVVYKGDEPAIWGDEPLTRIAMLDPGFTNGGDKSILKFALFGKTKDGVDCLCYDKEEELLIDVTDKSDNPSFQIAKQFKRRCEEEGALPQNSGIDATGAGGPFCDIVEVVWSRLIYRCHFGGKASELPVSDTDSTPGNVRYYDRVTEIWYSGRDFLRNGQLKGITPKMAAEMAERHYGTTGGDKKIYVESKKIMKHRTGGKSPDTADSGFIGLDLCRRRLKFSPAVGAKKAKKTGWRHLRQKLTGNILAAPRQSG